MPRLLLFAVLILVGLAGYRYLKPSVLSPEAQCEEILRTGETTGEKLGFLCATYPKLAGQRLKNKTISLNGDVQTAFISGMSQRRAGLEVFRNSHSRLLVVYDLDNLSVRPFSAATDRQVQFRIEGTNLLLIDPARRRRAILFTYKTAFSGEVVVTSVTPNLTLVSAQSYPAFSWVRN
jgi:hypothetical protein